MQPYLFQGRDPEGAWSLSLSVEKFTQRWVGAAGLQYYIEGTHQQGCACYPGEGAEPWDCSSPPTKHLILPLSSLHMKRGGWWCVPVMGGGFLLSEAGLMPFAQVTEMNGWPGPGLLQAWRNWVLLGTKGLKHPSPNEFA